LYTTLVSVYFEMLTILVAFIFLANYKTGSLSVASFNILHLIAAMYAVVFLFTAIKLFKRWYTTQHEKQLLEQHKLQTELKLKEAELKLLRAQLHPHFLFNTLNNLYGLAMEQSEQTAGAILKLSELLDYMLYKSDKPLVALYEEWQLINHYITLEKLRHSQLNLKISSDGPLHTVRVAPLLLLPLVENAFKHGSFGTSASFINISLKATGSHVNFKVANSINQAQHQAANHTGGIGLANIQKRADLLYPNANKVTTIAAKGQFEASLQLNINQHENQSHHH